MNNSYNLEKIVAEHLDNFYKARLQKIQTLNLRKKIIRKNPYLLRAVGTEKASEIIEYLLNSLLSASDETIFGNTFFEPIARIVSGGKVSGAEGVDFEVHKNNRISAYAVKSGTHWGNASQKKRINDEFSSLRSRLYKMYMQFDAVIGHGYGTQKNEPNSKRIFRDV